MTVFSPDSFQGEGQRVILGGVVDKDQRRMDSTAVLDATVDGQIFYEEESNRKLAKPAALDVNGQQFSLKKLDSSKLEDEIMETVEKDNEELLRLDSDPLVLKKGDLRLSVRWEQRGGHSLPGIGIAYLCRRDGEPPAVADPIALPFASHTELYRCQMSNLASDYF